MKRTSLFHLSAIFTFTTFLMILPAVAVSLTTNQSIEIVRPGEGKTFEWEKTLLLSNP
jgi:hypothetical protein